MKTRKPRTIWTDEEVRKVIEKAVELSLSDREFVWVFIARAQVVLPTERRRNISGRHTITEDLIEQFAEERQRILDQCFPEQVTVEKRVLVPQPRSDVLNNIGTEELLELLARRLAPIIDRLPTLVRELTERPSITGTVQKDVGSGNVPAIVEPANRLPRILLYGFLPGQQEQIVNRTQGFQLDLVFYEKSKQLSGTPPSCQWCVVFNKITHGVTGKLKERYGDRVTLVEGIDRAVQVLADLNSRRDL